MEISTIIAIIILIINTIYLIKKDKKKDEKKDEKKFVMIKKEHKFEKITQKGEYLCGCGLYCPTEQYFKLHIESVNSKDMEKDVTGWPKIQFDTVPYIKNVQKGILSSGIPHAIFIESIYSK
jgi:hypothetical protein